MNEENEFHLIQILKKTTSSVLSVIVNKSMELDINVYNFENWLFSIFKSDLRISAAGQHIEIIRIGPF